MARTTKVRLKLEKAELLAGKVKTDIGHIKGNALPARSIFRGAGGAGPENKKTVEWLVRVKGNGASATMTVISQKAGTKSRELALKAK